jgi:hypothetical protein
VEHGAHFLILYYPLGSGYIVHAALAMSPYALLL